MGVGVATITPPNCSAAAKNAASSLQAGRRAGGLAAGGRAGR